MQNHANHQKIDLVDILTINPHIVLDIRYATTNNFTHTAVYPLSRCYLRQKTAQKLNHVQNELETLNLGLKIFDGYRPLSIQKKFWQLVPDTRYVSNPYDTKKGSKHNRGAAVDVTLINKKSGQELIMPSDFDDFTERACLDYTKMSPEAAKNCKLLEAIMIKHGFKSYYNEWWHFNDTDCSSYELLDISFEELETDYVPSQLQS